MRRRLARKLDYPLAQIGLDGVDTRRLERRVEMDLLRGHAFGFNDRFSPTLV